MSSVLTFPHLAVPTLLSGELGRHRGPSTCCAKDSGNGEGQEEAGDSLRQRFKDNALLLLVAWARRSRAVPVLGVARGPRPARPCGEEPTPPHRREPRKEKVISQEPGDLGPPLTLMDL